MNHPRRKRIRPTDGRHTSATPRDKCFDCRRPKAHCYCDLIPAIQNKTKIIIAQHIRERSHPFNTARIVARALSNSHLIADYAENFRRHDELLDTDTGILFPSRHAVDLNDVPQSKWPRRLLLLDGTWNQVKRMYRKWPTVQQLRHFRLSPPRPGQYRIRLEPNDTSLSTIEATVMALKLLEPETAGLNQLLNVFQSMVDRQLAHPNAKYDAGVVQRAPTLNIPRLLLDRQQHLVIAYGEAEPVIRGRPKDFIRMPAMWVAKRITSNEKFRCPIATQRPVTESLLKYFELSAADFADAVSPDEFCTHWQAFQKPDDILVVFNASTLRLLQATGAKTGRSVSLQAVNYDPDKEFKSLREFLVAHQQSIPAPVFAGRPGQRLANLSALVSHLQQRLQALIIQP